MIDEELSFGDLRAATERALEEPTRVDAVVWCILRTPPHERTKLLEYATQKLRSTMVARVDLSELVRFIIEGEPWLCEHIDAKQDEYIENSELPGRMLDEDHVAAWCAGLAWLTVRRRGHIEWSGPTVRHWISRVDPNQGYWFGMGLNEGTHVQLYQGREDEDEDEDEQRPKNEPYVIRHCQIPDGDPWAPEGLPGWPESLNGDVAVDDDWETHDDEDYDA